MRVLASAERPLADVERPDIAAWAHALAAGVAASGELGDAKRGDRTILDALIPASEALLAAAQGNASLAEALERDRDSGTGRS
jgi:dihydroxyacetone kinase